MSRSLVHVLLSLLLLITQQMSLQHSLTHWDEGRAPTAQQLAELDEDDSGKLPKPALHELCAHCAASAQVAFALPSSFVRFDLPELVLHPLVAAQHTGIRLQAASVVQPRGPPLA